MHLRRFTRLALPLLPTSVFDLAQKARDVKVNGVRTTEDVVLHTGDVVDVFTVYACPMPEVVFKDEHLLVANKPSGISSVSNNIDEYTVQTWAETCYPMIAKEIRVCHRLDNQTSGLILIAKSTAMYEEVVQAFRHQLITKEYTCLVVGKPHPQDATCHAYLQKNAKISKVNIYNVPKENSQEICTEYHVLDAGEISRLRVVLHTGRTHQIRAHLAHLGYPILGDDVYGNRNANKQHKTRTLRLCATMLEFHAEGLLSYLLGQRFRINAPF